MFPRSVDCTGHGIPGVSLNDDRPCGASRQVLKASQMVYHFSSILALMDERLRQTLQHTSEGDALDYGMDIAISQTEHRDA